MELSKKTTILFPPEMRLDRSFHLAKRDFLTMVDVHRAAAFFCANEISASSEALHETVFSSHRASGGMAKPKKNPTA
jgi:hypothetical protein